MSHHICRLSAEGRTRDGFVPAESPRLSWKVATDQPDWRQTSATLEWERDGVASTLVIDSGESHLVAWPFEPLGERARGRLRVRVSADGLGDTGWSEPLELRAGFVGSGWQGEFLTLSEAAEPAHPALLRREFEVLPGLVSATLYAAAFGVYQVELNGAEVDDQVLKPGWTPYRQRVVHETTDVTGLVTPGTNAIGVHLAGGWFTEEYGFAGHVRRFYGEQPAFAAQLVLEYPDHVDVVATDSRWRITGQGPVQASGIYQGEHYDARMVIPGFAASGFDDSAWAAPASLGVPVIPTPRTAPPARATQVVAPVEIITTVSGRTVIDFGQNLVGRVRFRVAAPAGSQITLRHAEVLEAGEIATRPLRAAAATDSWVAAGTGIEEWEPRFTFHGFRYVEVTGWPGELDPAAVRAVVLHSDLERTGWFDSSHEQLNQLHRNVVWGMRGNFLYVPTDCPQRDERLGWTGDIQVFAPTASFLYDVNEFLASWLVDLALEQKAGGGVPFIVPDVLGSAATPAAAWGDAAVVVPMVLYGRFGDVETLRRQFSSMKDWVDQLRALAGESHLWTGGFQFGDWLDPDAPAERPSEAKVANDIVATAYLFRSSVLLAEAAEILGERGLAAETRGYAERVRQAWRAEFVTANGRIMSDAQTAYALAIAFDLAEDRHLARMGDRLAELCREAGYRIGTGFVGTPVIADALTRTGHVAAAGRLLLQSRVPSWLYSVTMGATTIWERWDSMLPDGTINPGEMTSFNHYAFGAIADWMHRVLAGLAPAAPGYRILEIRPRPIAGIEHVTAEHETPYGRASAGWRAESGEIVVTAVVPPNVSARVVLPDGATAEVGSGTHEWRVADPRPAAAIAQPLEDPTLAQLMTDEAAYTAVLDAMRVARPEFAESFAATTRWVDSITLAEHIRLGVPVEVVDAVTAALLQLNQERARLTAAVAE